MSSFLQSKDWMEFQESLGREVFEYVQDGISAKIIKHSLPFRKSYLYIPHGPVIDFNSMLGGYKNPISQFIKWLKELARGENAIFVKIEPLNDLIAQAFAERKFRKSRKEIQPSRTVIIDLGADEDEIYENLHHKARYNIRVSEKHPTKFVENGTADEFWALLKKTTERGNFSSYPKEYYQQLISFFGKGREVKIKTFFVKMNERPLAGAMVLLFGDTAYYIHACSDHDEQQFRSPYKLQWSIIKWLKNKGYKRYDLWGIDSHKWPGVTSFKLYWGGRTVEHPGSFDLPVSKLWYMMYKVFRSIKT